MAPPTGTLFFSKSLCTRLILCFRIRKSIKTEPGESIGSSLFSSKDLPKSMKLKLKGGAYVDPESGLEHKAHVFKRKDALYSSVLGSADVQSGRNSYYKLQLLKHDKKDK